MFIMNTMLHLSGIFSISFIEPTLYTYAQTSYLHSQERLMTQLNQRATGFGSSFNKDLARNVGIDGQQERMLPISGNKLLHSCTAE